MTKNLKKIFILCLITILSFNTISTIYIKRVNAEAIATTLGVMATGDALLFLMGISGVTLTTGAMLDDDVRNTLVNNYYAKCQADNISTQTRDKWISDLKNGTLDKTCACWDSFCTWVNGVKVGDSLNQNVIGGFSSSDFYGAYSYNGYTWFYNSENDRLQNLNLESIIIFNNTGSSNLHIIGYTQTGEIQEFNFGRDLAISSSSKYNGFGNNSISNNTNSTNIKVLRCMSAYGFTLWNTNYEKNYSSLDVSIDYTQNATLSKVLGLNDANDLNIGRDLIFLGNDSISKNQDSVPINWGGIGVLNPTTGELELSPDVIDFAFQGWQQIENDGVNSDASAIILQNIMDRLQELTDVIVGENVTGNDWVIGATDSIPSVVDRTDSDSISISQKIEPNQYIAIGNFKNVFPFCIPFDIFEFFKILNAQPVAPYLEIPFSIPTGISGGHLNLTEHTLIIDLSQYESISVVCRAMFLLLFIIGLAFVTRYLIKG